MLDLVKSRWHGPGGMAHVLKISFPLILSTSAHTIKMFTDRMFLNWHSQEEFAAGLQAGITAFVLICFFMGVAGYANTFVAQYTGNNRPERVGPAIWQAIYFAMLGIIAMAVAIPFSDLIFDKIGHDQSVRVHEVVYFKFICISCIPMVVGNAMSCFYTGRGKTWVVFWVNIISASVNVVLDYAMIFGKYGFPEMGIAGAGWATVISCVTTVIMYAVMFVLPENRRKYNTLSGFKLDIDLMKRLIRYGCPNGIHFTLDVAGFTLFIAFVGRLGNIELAATNLAFQFNHLAFFPMIGMGIGITIITGQALGKDRPEEAVRAAWSAAALALGYMIIMSIGFLVLPDVLLYPFERNADPVKFIQVKPLVLVLLKFVAVYCLLDAGNIVFSGVLRGAGDTRFVMLCSLALCWGVMVAPTYFIVKYQYGPGNGLYLSWLALTGFVCMLAVVFYLRFAWGKWKSMRVIEQAPPLPASASIDIPPELE